MRKLLFAFVSIIVLKTICIAEGIENKYRITINEYSIIMPLNESWIIWEDIPRVPNYEILGGYYLIIDNYLDWTTSIKVSIRNDNYRNLKLNEIEIKKSDYQNSFNGDQIIITEKKLVKKLGKYSVRSFEISEAKSAKIESRYEIIVICDFGINKLVEISLWCNYKEKSAYAVEDFINAIENITLVKDESYDNTR